MIFRRIFAALALLCALIAPAHAQKSKATLQTEFGVNFPDNVVGFITPSLLRITLTDVVNSYVDWLSCTGTGGVVYWSAGTPTCLTAGSNGQVLTLSSGIPAWVNTAANLTAGTGITLTGTTNVTVALTNQIAAAGPIGTATAAPTITYNAQGQLTTVSTTTITPALSSVTGVPANTIVANNTGSPANGGGLTPGQIGAMLCLPSRTVLITGTAQTYTTPTCNGVTATWLEVEVQGGGAGGGASGTTGAGSATAGNNSVFGALTANGGAISTAGSTIGGLGGTCSGSLGTQQNFPGSDGSSVGFLSATPVAAGNGGVSFYGGYGKGSAGNASASAGGAAPANSGGGGGGGGIGTTASDIAGAGGGAGCHISTVITSPAATITYTVGATAGGGAAGTSGNNGGQGAAGLITVLAHWQ